MYDHLMENYINTNPVQPHSQPFANNNTPDPLAVSFPLSVSVAPVEPSLQMPTNELIHDELFNGLDDFDSSSGLMAYDLTNVDPNMTYHCFDNEGQLAEEVRAPVLIAPKIPAITQSTPSSEVRQATESVPRKRKRYDEKGREKAKKIRRLGACFRCKIYKLPVIGDF